MRWFKWIQIAAIVFILRAEMFPPMYGAGTTAPMPQIAGLSPETIRGWGYDAATTALLLGLFRGGQQAGEGSVSWQILAYVWSYRPAITWAELTTNGDSWPRVGGGYSIRLNTRLRAGLGEVDLRLRTAGTLAHEVRHALWNSIWDSNEEEFYCQRPAGLVYEEMLRAGGYAADEAAFRARAVYPELKMDAASWVARFNWAPSGLDWAWQSDIARTALDVLWGPLVPLGHPPAMSDRMLGR
jgi:hypothetical protein